MKSSFHLKDAAARVWSKTMTQVAGRLDNWQHKVSIQTRNRWVLTVMGLLLLYGLFSLGAVFF